MTFTFLEALYKENWFEFLRMLYLSDNDIVLDAYVHKTAQSAVEIHSRIIMTITFHTHLSS